MASLRPDRCAKDRIEFEIGHIVFRAQDRRRWLGGRLLGTPRDVETPNAIKQLKANKLTQKNLLRFRSAKCNWPAS